MSKALSWLSEIPGSETPAPPDNVELLVGCSDIRAACFVWLRCFYNDMPPKLWPGCSRALIGDGYVVDEVSDPIVFGEWRYPKLEGKTTPADNIARIRNGRELAYNQEADSWKPQTK